MKLQQLRYLAQVVRSGCNISEAARVLHTSQPGVSKQLRLLEEELGMPLLLRSRNGVIAVAEGAQPVIELAGRIVADAEGLKAMARAQAERIESSLTLVTTHSIARHLLAEPLGIFTAARPGLRVSVNEASPGGALESLLTRAADVALSTQVAPELAELVYVPCYKLSRILVAPIGHPILRERKLSLQAIARYPLIAYSSTFTGRQSVDRAFIAQGVQTNVVLNALDADMVKTCVSNGLGIAVLSALSFDPKRDRGLRGVAVDHLFDASIVYASIRRESAYKQSMLAFIEHFAPHLRGGSLKAYLLGDSLPPPASLWRGHSGDM